MPALDLLRRLRKNPLVDVLVTLAIAIGIAYGVQLWIVKPYRIPSGSMERTFHVGDRVIAARFWYDFKDPKRGDIVIFHPNGEGDQAFRTDHVANVVFVKRLIGMPGDWIRGRHGKVEICKGPLGQGCRALKEPYVSSTQADFGDPINPQRAFHVPAGHYFMMGDNRNESDDSRDWGPITKGQMLGRAFMIYWPPSQISVF